jgi:hypothetical protein
MSVKTKRLRNTEAFQMLSRYRRQRIEEMGLPYISDREAAKSFGRTARTIVKAMTAVVHDIEV